MDHIFWSFGLELKLKNIIKAQNCLLSDSNGKEYIDLEAGIWCTSVGHSNPRINTVLKEQVEAITHSGYCYSHPVIEESSKEILAILGFSNGQCSFLSSGSEAVEFGIRVAQTILNKQLLLTFSHSFFGSYGSATVKSSDQWYCFNWLELCSQCPRIHECDPQCKQLQAIPFDRIGGFVFEPGSSGMIRFAPQSLIKNLTHEIKRRNGLLIANEITTGIGRTGKWFGFQHYDIIPDIVAMGKGLGNGYPVSATAFTHSVISRLKEFTFYYCQSHQNDPLGAAIAGEVIRVIKEQNLIERARTIGEKIIDRLNQLKKNTSCIKDVRGRGLMILIEFDVNQKQISAQYVHQKLFERGFITTCKPGYTYIRIDPAFTIEEHHVEQFLSSLESIVQ